jgi:hypothetical protein
LPRPEDLALLRRVEAELALEAALGATFTAPLPARAAGAVELVRELPGGEAAVVEALAGRPDALRAALLPQSPSGLPPALVHHAAALRARELALATTAEEARAALEGLVSSWLELGRERAHLESSAARAAAPTLDARVRARLVDGLALRGVEQAEELAREGLATRTPRGHGAVQALRSVERWCVRLALPADLAARATERARLALDGLVSRWLGQHREAVEDLLARDWSAVEASRLLREAQLTWEWLDREPELERHVLTTLPELAWPVYRRRAMTELGAMLEPVMPLAWALEQRALEARERGTLDRDLPYVAPCAQALVFWAECTRDLGEGVARIERAYALCPTLRNARVVLAHLLCDRAEHTLATRAIFPEHPARADVERARAVFPELSRLEALERRVGLRAPGAAS